MLKNFEWLDNSHFLGNWVVANMIKQYLRGQHKKITKDDKKLRTNIRTRSTRSTAGINSFFRNRWFLQKMILAQSCLKMRPSWLIRLMRMRTGHLSGPTKTMHRRFGVIWGSGCVRLCQIKLKSKCFLIYQAFLTYYLTLFKCSNSHHFFVNSHLLKIPTLNSECFLIYLTFLAYLTFFKTTAIISLKIPTH